MSIAMRLELIELKLAQAEIADVQVTDDAIVVDLMDGRTILAPIVWFPRLSYGTPEERSNFTFARDSIHWPELDEDIGVRTLLLGRGLGESPQSLQRWLDEREAQRQRQAAPMPEIAT